MKVTFSLDDDVYAKYRKQSKTKDDVGARDEIKKRLAEFQDCDHENRHVLLVGDERRAIERILQTTIDTPERLTREISKLCTFQIGPVEYQFTSDQLARIHQQAEFFGWTPEQLIKTNVDEIVQAFLQTV